MKNFLVFTLVLILVGIVSATVTHDRLIFFSRNHTTLLKGIAILTVLWGHIGLAYHFYSIQWIAGIGVTLFLICSGYGLEASFNKNGLAHYWKKRIIAVIIPYWIVYLLAGVLLNSNFNMKVVIEILIFIRANWYIPYILIVYVIYWCLKFLTVRFKLSKKKFYLMLFTSFTIWFVIVSYYFIIPSATSLLARQMYAFPLGVIFYDYYKNVESIFIERSWKSHVLFGGLAIFSLGVNVLTNVSDIFSSWPNLLNNVLSLFTIVPLAIVLIRISCIAYPLFSNGLFKYLGVISYEIYLIQYFSRGIVNENPISLYFCFLVTIFLSWIFYLAYMRIKNLVLKK
ncbi:hypothetical protein C5Z26_00580 [Lactobacillus sp. CBA3606]|uniref:acyltransferase family protein n=1 Tax=Lactobacillus sp. CBA3606 TaxID=2099789 RepID=UPI000CFDCFC3|nr:acyltransferase [Lactobacillus sp. CBA3606]AVK62724.1 hypothetical protein C5Z26_00580 [Lactobacillus sp. CBA3606]